MRSRVEVFPGNTSDPNTLQAAVSNARERFGLTRVVFVGDREQITDAHITADLQSPDATVLDGLAWITALRAPAIRSLVEGGDVQRSLFDQHDLGELTSDAYPGERLIACRHPRLAGERARKRVKLLAALDGIYVIRTKKSADMEVRPIYYRKDTRIRAHVLVCMLAHYVVWHMKRAPRRGAVSATHHADRTATARLPAARRTRVTTSASCTQSHARVNSTQREALPSLTCILLRRTSGEPPAVELAALYHARWEIETAFDGFKTHLHTLSFTDALRVTRRTLAHMAALPSQDLARWPQALLHELRAECVRYSRGRAVPGESNGRVVTIRSANDGDTRGAVRTTACGSSSEEYWSDVAGRTVRGSARVRNPAV